MTRIKNIFVENRPDFVPAVFSFLLICAVLTACQQTEERDLPSYPRSQPGVSSVNTTQPLPAPNQDSGIYFTSGPRRGTLTQNKPAPVYSEDPDDPWNVLFHLLYTTMTDVEVPEYYFDESPRQTQDKSPRILKDSGKTLLHFGYFKNMANFRKVRWRIGGDKPDFYFTDDVAFLIQNPRYDDLIRALTLELQKSPPGKRTAEARILFQQDLWNRFDALYLYLEDRRSGAQAADREAQDRLSRLRSLIGALIVHIACTREEIRKVKPNYSDVANAEPEIPGSLFDKAADWRCQANLVHTTLQRNPARRADSATIHGDNSCAIDPEFVFTISGKYVLHQHQWLSA